MDLQLNNQAQVKKKMKMKSSMNLKSLMNSTKCTMVIQNLNKCLENIPIDILLKRNVQSSKLIKRAEVFKV